MKSSFKKNGDVTHGSTSRAACGFFYGLVILLTVCRGVWGEQPDWQRQNPPLVPQTNQTWNAANQELAVGQQIIEENRGVPDLIEERKQFAPSAQLGLPVINIALITAIDGRRQISLQINGKAEIWNVRGNGEVVNSKNQVIGTAEEISAGSILFFVNLGNEGGEIALLLNQDKQGFIQLFIPRNAGDAKASFQQLARALSVIVAKQEKVASKYSAGKGDEIIASDLLTPSDLVQLQNAQALLNLSQETLQQVKGLVDAAFASPAKSTSISFEKTGAHNLIPSPDGNGDGAVNILDLVKVALNFGGAGSGDINGDGVVNILDIVTTALYFGETAHQIVIQEERDQDGKPVVSQTAQVWFLKDGVVTAFSNKSGKPNKSIVGVYERNEKFKAVDILTTVLTFPNPGVVLMGSVVEKGSTDPLMKTVAKPTDSINSVTKILEAAGNIVDKEKRSEPVTQEDLGNLQKALSSPGLSPEVKGQVEKGLGEQVPALAVPEFSQDVFETNGQEGNTLSLAPELKNKNTDGADLRFTLLEVDGKPVDPSKKVTINEKTGQITLETTLEDSGRHSFKLTVTNPKNQKSDTAIVQFNVGNKNQLPTVSVTSAPTVPVEEGKPVSIQLEGKDPDLSDNLEYRFTVVDGIDAGKISQGSLQGKVFTWTPDWDAASKTKKNVVITVRFEVSDGSVNEKGEKIWVGQEVKFTIQDVNQLPTLNVTLAASPVEEGKVVQVNLDGKDVDQDLLVYRFEVVSGADPSQMAGAKIEGNTFSWTPASEIAGQKDPNHPVVLQFKVSDDGGKNWSNPIPATVTIKDVNRLPTLEVKTSPTGPIDEKKEIKIAVSGKDEDKDLLKYRYNVVSGVDPARLSNAQFNENTGEFSWMVPSDVASQAVPNQLVTLLFEVSDDGGVNWRSPQPVSFVIKNVGQSPTLSVISAPVAPIQEGGKVEIKVQGKDEDNEPLTYRVTGFDPGKVTGVNFDEKTGVFTWTPSFDIATQANSSVEVTFQFEVSDDQTADPSKRSWHDPEPVKVTITNVNHNPTLAATASPSGAVEEGTPITIKVEGKDEDKDPLKYRYTIEGIEKDKITNIQFNENDGSFTGISSSDIATLTNPTRSFTIRFEVSDDNGKSWSETAKVVVPVEVKNRNQTPTLEVVGAPVSQNEGGQINVALKGTDGDNNPLQYRYTITNTGETNILSNASFSWNVPYTIASKANPTQQLTIRFEVSDDGSNWYDAKNVNVSIQHVNQPPIINSVSPQTVTEGNPASFTVTGADPDGDDSLIYRLKDTQGTSAQFNGTTFNWTPGLDVANPANPSRTFSFVIDASDDGGTTWLSSTTAQVIVVDFIPPSEPPVWDPAVPSQVSINENQSWELTLKANDSQGKPVSYNLVGTNAPGLRMEAGKLIWQTNYNHAGDYYAEVTANNGEKTSQTKRIQVTVNNVNRPPEKTQGNGGLGIATGVVKAGTSVSIPIPITDPDGEPLTYEGAPTGATAANGQLTWTPPLSEGGKSVSFTITGKDPSGAAATATININVTENLPPVSSGPKTITVSKGGTVSLDSLITDPDGDKLTYTQSGAPAGVSIDSTTGKITSASLNTVGTSSFTITGTDPFGRPKTETITVIVEPPPPPVLVLPGPITFTQDEVDRNNDNDPNNDITRSVTVKFENITNGFIIDFHITFDSTLAVGTAFTGSAISGWDAGLGNAREGFADFTISATDPNNPVTYAGSYSVTLTLKGKKAGQLITFSDAGSFVKQK